MTDRVVDPSAVTDTIEDPKDRGLLELPERQGRAHAGDALGIPGAPPAGGDLQVGDLVISGRALRHAMGDQAPADDRGGQNSRQAGDPSPWSAHAGGPAPGSIERPSTRLRRRAST